MMDENVKKFLKSISYTATIAAEEAKAAVQSAGKAINQKTELAKMNVELLGLQADMEEIFCELGRTLFLMNTGSYNSVLHGEADTEEPARHRINTLLVQAGEKQQEIDFLNAKVKTTKGINICPVCERACEDEDVFCPACGAKLEVPVEKNDEKPEV
ncbi:MAG: hypothetical protein PHG02_00585 [Oscillospiraceae bacterium]|nr:hypothetical protein [Oscillospiraceae bacterium]